MLNLLQATSGHVNDASSAGCKMHAMTEYAKRPSIFTMLQMVRSCLALEPTSTTKETPCRTMATVILRKMETMQ